jgi:hypothetical protein
MNRIYQGKVTAVEIPAPNLLSASNGERNKGEVSNQPEWQPFDPDPKIARQKWQDALWQHHELFQDAVNYYTLALAALAADLQPDTPKGKAALAWREQVRENWLDGFRKAVRYDGPHKRLARWLNVDASMTDEHAAFDVSAKAILKDNGSSATQRGKALLQLLEEADQSDLNQLCVSRLPWLCTPHGQLDATPKNVAQQQESKMLMAILEIHQASADQISAIAKQLDLGCFVTQSPKDQIGGAEARTEAERLFKSAAAKAKSLTAITDNYAKHLDQLGDQLRLPRLGRKPKGAYPLAVVFKLFPTSETWEAFKAATVSLRRKADKLKAAPVEIAADCIAEVRTDADQPVFDYFTNRVLFREPDNKDRAVWFDFDLAAFIEAIKSPHRFFQDTLTREKSAAEIREKLAAMEGRGGKVDDEHDDDEEFASGFGFEGDERIALLRELVTDTLGYVAEAENPGENSERIEYTIQERTLRGFEEIKEKWRKLSEKHQATPEKLIEALNEQQAKQRDDFGSATLYRALTQPKYHPIWRDPGTQKWHTSDPLKAWRAYKELRFELADTERSIRFTPAHAVHSPRYFSFPKKSEKKAKEKKTERKSRLIAYHSEHLAGSLVIEAGIVIRTAEGLKPVRYRLSYSAPRLNRDELRANGDKNLYSVSWIQPMMKALGFSEPDRQNFANCRVTLEPEIPRNQPSLLDENFKPKTIQLRFSPDVESVEMIREVHEMRGQKKLVRIRTRLKKREIVGIWDYQFGGRKEGKKFSPMWLSWPHEKEIKSDFGAWNDSLNHFSCVSVDLGQRDAGAFARLLASYENPVTQRPSRFIGKTGDKDWRAALERSGLFRLPGEDALVWRARTLPNENRPSPDDRNKDDTNLGPDYREELWGERGRPARPWEADETAELMALLEVPTNDEQLSLLSDNWRDELSFPEQNGKLLIAMRRYQSRISRLHRWCWFLKGEEKQQKSACVEIAECEDTRLISAEQRAAATKHDPRLLEELETQLRARLKLAPTLLVRIANRVLPLRGRSWHWDKHRLATDENPIHQLTQGGPSLDSKEHPVWLRGQRGLSLERIEQIEELRKRFQSLNQTLRRKVGGKPPIRRDESVPDPCPDLLEKLDNLKEQRVNQTAHMILAEALGLRLAPPPADKKKLRQEKDQHGVYEKILDRQGNWIGPVDFIVIEDLSRYRATQGRAPRENSRLMKWCHRAVRDKLKQLCEVFGLPVLETPAAYSSRCCSRSGVPGFRAAEVTAGFTQHGQWAWLAGKKDENNNPKEEAQRLLNLDKQLSTAQADLERDWKGKQRPGVCPKRTLFVPSSGGPVFVPVVGTATGSDLQPAVAQADINAAINLALRAIADPNVWSIHPRLRTQRDKKDGSLTAREKRKFGEKNPPKLAVTTGEEPIKDYANPNFFADFAGLVDLAGELGLVWLNKEWTFATLPGEKAAPVPLLHSKSFWGTVKAYQWKRIDAINSERLAAWRNKLNPMPD